MPRSPRPRRRATLASLAAELKVSRTTVSNAYNRPDQLSPELRERVLAAAKELGYPGPDPVARSLRTRKADTIGLLLDQPLSYSFRDPAAVEFVAGLADACDAAGKSLLIVPAGPERDAEQAAAAVQRAGVDGFVVYSVAADDPYLSAALERQLPVVICDQPLDVPGTSRVGIDDYGAMHALAGAVLSAGHTRIGIICMRLGLDDRNELVGRERAETAPLPVQSARIRAILDAADAAGNVSVSISERSVHSRDAGYSAAGELLSEDTSITALMCTTDVLALGALTYARDNGISVPAALSVTGFDGIPEGKRAGLATVAQPSALKGRRAGELLISYSPDRLTVEMLPTMLSGAATLGPSRGR
ncbi:LacI family DNA-binding transcriptional regulator [Hoyosella sp. YIM 151337]|uniref:LacI family DNA-binding transcriptional regulator n=1 Tax=Hoyosella sp. YIM 151337 TaxID=2992742 RepID=UPI002235F94F|nr:LacI family DNA-binding transcriptional regulator [Hoyosella sp. YIM 151337]MCW4354953.1 LacI family DNA-binding transcriptional regulator [Hoyosella sp. YIM 151337]